MMKVDRKMKELSEGDVKANVSITEYPKDVTVPSELQLKAELAGKLEKPAPAAEQSVQQNAPAASGAASDVPKPAASSAAPPATAVPEKVRHEWYQSHNAIVVTLYVKNIPKDKVETELKDESVSTIPVQG
jgi:CS domain.